MVKGWAQRNNSPTAQPCLEEPDICCSVSSKSGLRVNFLAVICEKEATTSCRRLGRESHYFNPSVPDINRMNKWLCSLLNLDQFIQMAPKKISKSPRQVSFSDSRRQREVTLPLLFLPLPRTRPYIRWELKWLHKHLVTETKSESELFLSPFTVFSSCLILFPCKSKKVFFLS